MGLAWDGRAVHVAKTNPAHDRRSIDIALTPEAANNLALALMRNAQTYLMVPEDIKELLDALNFVMVADPASVKAHRRMEAGKGMTPDGGR